MVREKELAGFQFTIEINQALEHHKAGRLPQAEALYRQILESQPNHPDAFHLLGVIAHQAGKHDAAVKLIGRAIGFNANVPHYHNNLGEALRALQKFDAAIAAYQQALGLNQDYTEAHTNLGNAFQQQGKLTEAIASYQQALALKPVFEAHYMLASAFHKQGKLPETVASYRQAIACSPNYAEAHYTLGIGLNEQGNLSEAIASYQRAIVLRPDYARAHNNLGNALKEQDNLTEALTSYQQAILHSPDFAEAHYNLGIALQQQGKLSEAITSYQQAISLKPDYAEAHMNKAFALLLSGRFKEGWPEYEWRLLCKLKKQRSGFLDLPQPKWDGSEFSGKTLLIYAEQGIGDTIQFVRYLPLVKAKGGRVLLACQPELSRLLDGFPGVDVLLDKTKIKASDIAFDLQVPLMSLPGIFDTDLDSVPNIVPYIRARPELVKAWSERVNQETYNVGIVWAGRPEHLDDRNRSCPLQAFAPLARLAGVSLYSLQKGPASEQVAAQPNGMKVTDYSAELNDFVDTAALVSNLDLVVTVDTAVAHLCGALGLPVWTLLMYSPDWRWLIDRADTPWYPTMRLFRPPTPRDWDTVMGQVAANLEAAIQQRSRHS